MINLYFIDREYHMKSLLIIDWVALALVIISGIHWGLVGLLKLDLVATLFGEKSLGIPSDPSLRSGWQMQSLARSRK